MALQPNDRNFLKGDFIVLSFNGGTSVFNFSNFEVRGEVDYVPEAAPEMFGSATGKTFANWKPQQEYFNFTLRLEGADTRTKLEAIRTLTSVPYTLTATVKNFVAPFTAWPLNNSGSSDEFHAIDASFDQAVIELPPDFAIDRQIRAGGVEQIQDIPIKIYKSIALPLASSPCEIIEALSPSQRFTMGQWVTTQVSGSDVIDYIPFVINPTSGITAITGTPVATITDSNGANFDSLTYDPANNWFSGGSLSVITAGETYNITVTTINVTYAGISCATSFSGSFTFPTVCDELDGLSQDDLWDFSTPNYNGTTGAFSNIVVTAETSAGITLSSLPAGTLSDSNGLVSTMSGPANNYAPDEASVTLVNGETYTVEINDITVTYKGESCKVDFIQTFTASVVGVIAGDFFVTTSGSDSNDGTDLATAWATLEKVVTEGNAGNIPAGSVIRVEENGIFAPPTTALGANFSGTNASRIIFDTTTGSGTFRVTGFYDASQLAFSGSGTTKDASIAGLNIFSGFATIDTGSGRRIEYPADSGPQTIISATNNTGGSGANSNDDGTVTSDYFNTIGDEVIGKYVIGSGAKWDRDRRKATARNGNVVTLEGDAKALDSPAAAGSKLHVEGLLSEVPNGTNNQTYAVDESGQLIRMKTQDANPALEANLHLCAHENGFNLAGASYITFKRVKFDHFWNSGIFLASNASDFIEAQNCEFQFCYQSPFFVNSDFGTVDGIKVLDCTITDISGTGIYLGASIGAQVRRNTIRNIANIKTGKLLGVLDSKGGAHNHFGCGVSMRANSSGNLIEDNIITVIGYAGIRFDGTNHIIRRNFIRRTLENLSDGGGLYAFGNNNEQTGGSLIEDNVVIDSFGDLSEYKSQTAKPISACLYLDNRCYGMTVRNNYFSNETGSLGIMLNRWNRNHTVTGNLVRVGARQGFIGGDQSGLSYCLQIVNQSNNDYSQYGNIRTGGMTITNNTFVYLRPEGGYLMRFLNQDTLTGSIQFDPRTQWDSDNYTQGTFSGNKYVMPYGEIILEQQENGAAPDQERNLAELQAFLGDAGATHTIKNWTYVDNDTSVQNIKLMVNWPGELVQNTFTGAYTDLDGSVISSPVTIPDYTCSVILAVQ